MKFRRTKVTSQGGVFSRWFPPVVAAAVLAASVVSTVPAHLPATPCPFYNLTGLPCPGCGMTRGFVAMGHGRPADAWRYNALAPAFFAALCAYVLWFGANLFMPLEGVALWLKRRRKALYAVALCLIALSWGLSIWRHSRGRFEGPTPLVPYLCSLAGRH